MFSADLGLADTIVARATAHGEAARMVVRLSGDLSLRCAASVMRPDPSGAPSLRAVEGAIVLDDVLVPARALLFRAPRSYTGEDVVELHTLSAPSLENRLLMELVRSGARPARPGEFTRRAFLNGRLDLAAAEAVLALTQGATASEARAAARALRGGLRDAVARLRAIVLDALAALEASLDFAHEDIEADLLSAAGFRETLLRARGELEALLRREAGRGPSGELPRVVLYGPVNAGKSSLLNALARRELALVSPSPRTTRDPLAVRVEARGTAVEIVDTAGLSDEPHPSAPSGVEGRIDLEIDSVARDRASGALETADLAILVLDRSVPLGGAGIRALEATRGVRRIVALQKADLEASLDARAIGKGELVLEVSARTARGLADLEAAVAAALATRPPSDGTSLAPNARHRACLERARDSLEQGIRVLSEALPLELVAIDLRAALDAVGEVTGASCPEEVLDRIFARFCIGK